MLIVFSGTQSVGKTTLQCDLEKVRPDYVCRQEPIRLLARARGVAPPEVPTMEAEQRLIEFGAAMVHAEPPGARVLFDRGPLDAFAHAVFSMERGGDVTPAFLASMRPKVYDALRRCDVAVYVPIEEHVVNVDDGFRYLDEAGRRRVDAILRCELSRAPIPVATVRGTRLERVEHVQRLM